MRSYKEEVNVASPTPLETLVANAVSHRDARGSEHTCREVAQQPELWRKTAKEVVAGSDRLAERLDACEGVILTGSGSSHFVGLCIRGAVQRGSGRTTTVVGSGELLLGGSELYPTERPLLLVSFARSGNSPESCGLIASLLQTDPEIDHLVVTCNPRGRAASEWADGGEPRVLVETLDERTCDVSLVMTSSFTNMALAGLGLAYTADPDVYLERTETLARVGEDLIEHWSERIAPFARQRFSRMIALGSGPQYGAARESALKMLEMTGGRVATFAESWLGFRHGPMCVLQDDSLLLVFVSGEPTRRAYQLDLLREIRSKGLGGGIIAVGQGIPPELLSDRDLAIDCPGLSDLPDEWAAIAGVVVGQLLGLFRCLEEGLQPDEPTLTGVISRVVPEFKLYSA